MTDLFNTGIRPAIDAYLLAKSREKRDYGQYWSASSAGYCMRRQIFERLGVPYTSEDARKERVFEAGHIFHAWLQGLTKEAGLSIAQELELQDEELLVRGHIDDLVLIEGQPILYDYKTVHSRSFHWAKKEGYPMSYFHRMQVGTYLYLLRRLLAEDVKPAELDGITAIEEARILKLSKDDLCMSEQQLLYDAALETEVVDYWAELQSLWAAKKVPPCTCHLHENGFMAREQYNPYWFNGEPCSLEWLAKCRKEGTLATRKTD